jgi:hypothetical protein
MATGLEHLYSNLDLLIDLLVDLSPEHSLLGVISLRQDLDALLGARLMSQKRYPMGATGPGAVAAGFSAGVQHPDGGSPGADRGCLYRSSAPRCHPAFSPGCHSVA